MKKVSIKPGGAPRPLSCAERFVFGAIWICMESIRSIGSAWKAIIILFYSATVLQSYGSNFEMMSSEDPKLGQDSSHLATPVTGAHRSRSFSHPVGSHSFLVCSPSPCGERPFSLLPVSPLFVARLGFFLRLLLRASLGDVAWRRVTSVQPASRQTTCCRLGNKTFGCCVYC